MSTALIVVDVQNDFLPGGSLGVPDGFEVIDIISEFANQVDHVALTADWHPPDHFSFDESPSFEDGSWPAHCVQNTHGAELVMEDYFPDAPIFRKGFHPNIEAYSGFDGVGEIYENLVSWLDDNQVECVVVAGLALDYCVNATAQDAVYNGWNGNTCVLLDGTRPVSYVTGAMAVAEMAGMDIVFGDTQRLTSLLR